MHIYFNWLNLLGIPEMERKLKETGLKLLNELIQLEHSKVEAFSVLQKAIANKAHSTSKMSIFKQENEELNNLIQTAQEKLQTAQVFIKKLYAYVCIYCIIKPTTESFSLFLRIIWK